MFDLEVFQSFDGNHRSFVPRYGCVLVAFDLNVDLLKADHLFNLVSLYGNVLRIKIIRNKNPMVFIQMATKDGQEKAQTFLNGVSVFGSTLTLRPSRQNQVYKSEHSRGGNDQYVDYTGSPDNRFQTPGMAQKNRLVVPSPFLHFFNLPLNLSDARALEDELLALGGKRPAKIQIFSAPRTARSLSGTLEMKSTDDAVETLMMCNNARMKAYEWKEVDLDEEAELGGDHKEGKGEESKKGKWELFRLVRDQTLKLCFSCSKAAIQATNEPSRLFHKEEAQPAKSEEI